MKLNCALYIFRFILKLVLSLFFHSFLFPLSHSLLSVVFVDMCDQDRKSFIGDTGKLLCLCSEIFMCEHGMPCDLEINSKGRSKSGHVEFALQPLKHHISTAAMHMAFKLDRVVTYDDGLPPIKSHDLLITWSCEIT